MRGVRHWFRRSVYGRDMDGLCAECGCVLDHDEIVESCRTVDCCCWLLPEQPERLPVRSDDGWLDLEAPTPHHIEPVSF